MSYQAPAVTAAGLSTPSYDDILQFLTTALKNIYGQTIDLGNDAYDFQDASIRALSLSDAMQSIQLDYNNRSPNFAIGAALSSVVKINGLTRKVATFSTCQVTIAGVAGTVINNGIVRDTAQNFNWALPSVVTIPISGTISVSAQCQIAGAVNALAGTLTTIGTPTAGWTSVTNPSAASVGQPVELDSELRSRQAVSVELPSLTPLAGTIAAVLAVPGVTRINPGTGGFPNPIENPTSAVDSFGNPPHSITMVVEGGTDLGVATAIYNKRGIGPFTNGTGGGGVTVAITDPHTGVITNIGFQRPVSVDIYVTVTTSLLAGGTPTDQTRMHDAIVLFLNSLQIGKNVNYGSLIAAAMSVNPDPTKPIITVETLFLGTSPSPGGTTDVTIDFNKVAHGDPAKVIVS